MADSGVGSTTLILVTILLGMVLAVVPAPYFIPAELGYFRPDWIALILVYWVIALPHRVGLTTAWLTGLSMDVLLGTLLGQHALSYLVLAYIALNLYQRLRMFSVWQQAMVLFALLGLNELINFWAESVAGLSDWSLWYLSPALSGAMLWPFVFLFLRAFRRRFGVS